MTARLLRSSGEGLVFSGTVVIGLLHGLDDAFLHAGPGTGPGRHALAAGLTLLAAVAAIAAFGRSRPGLRAVLALCLAAPMLGNAATHVLHAGKHGVSGGDFTGLVAAAAGIALIGLAASIPWRHRAERAVTPGRRWANRALGTVGTVVALVVIAGPVGLGVAETHKQRAPVGAPPSDAYESVAFETSDGMTIAGWYRPSRNGATVIAIHGGGSDRNGAMRHAEMLAEHGYGVLAYDARGRGESEGSSNSYGWDWDKDAIGALDYLQSRDDVDPDRIAALGLSSGADTAIDLAAQRSDLAAVISDGAALRTFEDARRLNGLDPLSVSGAILFKTVEVMTGSEPPESLYDLVPKVESPTLLISAGTTDERAFNVDYDRIGQPATEHWNLPDSRHTAAIRTHRDEYEQRVIDFLDDALFSASQAR